MDNANGKINPFTKPAISSNSLGFPKKTNREVETTIKAVITFLSF